MSVSLYTHLTVSVQRIFLVNVLKLLVCNAVLFVFHFKKWKNTWVKRDHHVAKRERLTARRLLRSE